jgi:drug/metabolite transporter (DMT)-like permease
MPVAVAFGLAAGLCVGGADFLGGLAARRRSALVVALWSQVAAGIALLGLLPLAGRPPDAAALLWGLGAGVCSGISQVCFFRALALGSMGIVAPVAGCGAALPVVAGFASGDRPGPLALGGLVATFGGIILVSLRTGRRRRSRAAIVLALTAAAGLGLFYLLIARGAATGGTPAWTVAGDALGSLAVLVPLALTRRRAALCPGRAGGLLAAGGLLDLAGNVAYSLAVAHGSLSTASALVALYPAVTVALGWVLLAERLTWVQRGGMFCALIGGLLLGTG